MSATPTPTLSFQNFFSATLTADMTASSTDVFLDTIPNGTEGFLVIDPDSTSAREVIYYNSKTVAKVVCPSVADGRGQDDTTAGAHLTGTTVIMAPVAAFYEALQSGLSITDSAITTAKLITGIQVAQKSSNPYKFSAYLTTAQNVGTAFTKVAFDTKIFDTGSNLDIVTNKGRFTAPVAGFYHFNATTTVTTAGAGTFTIMALYKNGSIYCYLYQFGGTAGQNFGGSGSTLISLAANDYVEVYVASGAAAKALDVGTPSLTNTFSGFLVSAT